MPARWLRWLQHNPGQAVPVPGCSAPPLQYTLGKSLAAEQMLDANPCLKPCFDHLLLLLLLFHPSKYFPWGLHPTNCFKCAQVQAQEENTTSLSYCVLSCTFNEEEIAKQPLHTSAPANPSLYYCWAVSILWTTRKHQFKVQVPVVLSLTSEDACSDWELSMTLQLYLWEQFSWMIREDCSSVSVPHSCSCPSTVWLIK